MDSSFRKIVQKKVYDVVSHRYGLILVLVGAFALGISAFQFGEAVAEWSREKYAAVFNSFSDNIGHRSFRQRLCLPVPIDVVYTWVNGTDEETLRELQKIRRDLERELNITREEKCTFSNCIPASRAVLDPYLSPTLTLQQLVDLYPQFSGAVSIHKLHSEDEAKLNVTIVVYQNETEVKNVSGMHLAIGNTSTTVNTAFYTSDASVSGGILLHDTILMSGFPHHLTSDQVVAALPHPVDRIRLFSDKGVAVLYVSKKATFDSLMNMKNFTLDGKEPTLSAAKLVWNLRGNSRHEDFSASRFEDNEELRYSLRSVEKYAPWVRHIYIVTNGQLPYWLDLESPRITVVTHNEIFPNKTHLPTYSSPAIESHLHRIPGLSDKFIYLNDDVMFGSEVWPDDFFSHGTGQKVYLTWPVPNCNDGCPSTWIKDGYCDKACNISECDWDAGDCDGDGGRLQLGAGFQGGYGDHAMQEIGYCNSGCANNWIADKYCDTACNTKQCGFDAGDCGIQKFDQLHKIDLTFDENKYKFPPGEYVGYFNLTGVVSADGMITEAFYNDSKMIRQVAVGNKFKVMTVVLQANHSETILSFQVIGHQGGNKTFRFNFTLTVNTEKSLMEEYEKTLRRKQNVNASDTEEEEENDIVIIPEVPENLQGPKVSADQHVVPPPVIPPDFDKNFTNMSLPASLQEELNLLNLALGNGDLTAKGFHKRWLSLYGKYVKFRDDPNHKMDIVLKGQGPSATGNRSEVKTVGSKGNGQGEGVNPSLRKLLFAFPRYDNDVTAMNKRRDFRNYSTSMGRRTEVDLEASDVGAEFDLEGGRDFLARVKVGLTADKGALPWERKTNMFTRLLKMKENILRVGEQETPVRQGRRLLDTFGDSLRHVNKLYNRAFGFLPRKVPAHMPHMIDKHIMADLQAMFPKEWDVTSSHKIRHSQDMQYAFSYFYYLMGVTEDVTAEHVFREMDTDDSRVLSDRELRTFAARLYDLPLYLETLQGLEQIFVNCSNNLSKEEQALYPPAETEAYYDKAMPQVTRSLFLSCGAITKLIKDKFRAKPKYKYTTVDDAEVTFYMIQTNVSSVVGQLDHVRKESKKFVCLNDNIEHGSEEAKTVKAVLQDFYESLYPITSQFELPRDYRNRFLHVNELREWRRYRDWLKFWTHLALIVLVMFSIVSFFGDKIEAAHRRLSRATTVREDGSRDSSVSADSDSTPSKQRPLLAV